MKEEMKDYMDSFVSEIEALLDTVNYSVKGFETGNQDEIDEFLRAVHTIKGMGAMMGFQELTDLAHAIEDMAKGWGPDKKELTAGIMEGVGILERASNMAVNEGDTGGISDEVRSFIRRFSGTKSGMAVHSLTLKMKKDEPMKGIRAQIIKRNLSEFGEVISFSPEPENISDDFNGEISVKLRSELGLEELRKRISGIRGVDSVKKAENKTRGGRLAERGRHSTIRMPISKIEELQAEVEGIILVVSRMKERDNGQDIQELSAAVQRLADRILRLRTIPVSSLKSRFSRIVEETALKEGKSVLFEMNGSDVEIDREIIYTISEGVMHILKNCVSHGIEKKEERLAAGKPSQGKVSLNFKREGSVITIEISDDGKGIDRDTVLRTAVEKGMMREGEDADPYKLIFLRGFTTSEHATETSGRGVGLDMVKDMVDSYGGEMEVKSEKGIGTTFIMRIPFSTGIVPALLVKIGEKSFAIPTETIARITEVNGNIFDIDSRTFIRDGNTVNMLVPVEGNNIGSDAVILKAEDGNFAVSVDAILGIERVVLKRINWVGKELPFRYLTILPDGDIAFILEPSSIGKLMKETEGIS